MVDDDGKVATPPDIREPLSRRDRFGFSSMAELSVSPSSTKQIGTRCGVQATTTDDVPTRGQPSARRLHLLDTCARQGEDRHDSRGSTPRR
jgi:hypothetical protein